MGKIFKSIFMLVVAVAAIALTVQPVLAAPPTAPSNLSATAVSQTQINLSWIDNSSNETGFKIERSANGTSFSQIATVEANVTTYQNTSGLSPNTTYWYRVRAYKGSQNSSYSNIASATTLPNPPSAPTSLNTSIISQTQINLNWTDNATNEIGFKIERSDGGVNFSQINITIANEYYYWDWGLSPGTYYYRVRAYNNDGDSNYSNIDSDTVY